MERNRWLYLCYVVITIIVGLLTRRYAAHLPYVVNLMLGDVLWALMVYWLVGMVFRTASIPKVVLIGLTFCFLIEISQLYQGDWINAIRANRFGRLVLGRGFLWSDFIAYTLGIGIGGMIEYKFRRTLKRQKPFYKE